MKKLAAFLTFFGGLYFFLEFLLPETLEIGDEKYTFGIYHQQISLSLALISSMAIGLGVINIILVHGGNIVRFGKGVSSSLGLIFSFCLTLYVLLANWIVSESASGEWEGINAISTYLNGQIEEGDESIKLAQLKEKLPYISAQIQGLKLSPDKFGEVSLGELKQAETELRDFSITLSQKDQSEAEDFQAASVKVLAISKALKNSQTTALDFYKRKQSTSYLGELENLLLYGFFFPLGLSMFSILGFYVVSAAYRSFRVKSKESAVMMGAALLVVLGQIPQGVLYISEDLPAIRLWIFSYISTPAFRAIYFTSVIAGLSLAVRMWLSIDKNPFLTGSK